MEHAARPAVVRLSDPRATDPSLVGAKAAKRILVINTDPEAPIFRRASYAVIGDVHTVVPAITAEVRRAKGAG